MSKQTSAVIHIIDGPTYTIDVKVDFLPRGATDDIVSHKIAADMVAWLYKELHKVEQQRGK